MFIGTENLSLITLINIMFILILISIVLKNLSFNIKTAKITNWYYTHIVAIMYIIAFIGFFLFLRIIVIKNPINLKIVWNFITNIIYIMTINNISQNLIVLFIIIIFY